MDRMERVDKHVGAAKRNSGRDTTLAETKDDVGFGNAGQTGLSEPCRQFGKERFIHPAIIQASGSGVRLGIVRLDRALRLTTAGAWRTNKWRRDRRSIGWPAALGHQRRIGGGVGEAFVFDKGVRRPFVVDEIFKLRAGAIGIETATCMIDRQLRQAGADRADRLRERDAVIRIDRRRRGERHARSGRPAKLPGRHNGIEKQVAGGAALAAEALPHFAVSRSHSTGQ